MPNNKVSKKEASVPVKSYDLREVQGISSFLKIPAGVSVRVNSNMIYVKGKVEESREIREREVKITVEENQLKFSTKRDNKIARKIIGTLKAHIKNSFKGVTEGHVYRLKICSGHFPMNVSVSKNDFIIKNFIGEKVPRVMRINQRANVRVEGDYVIVESSNKEVAGQTAAQIETLTKRAGYDTRVFEDGIYITNKDGKEI